MSNLSRTSSIKIKKCSSIRSRPRLQNQLSEGYIPPPKPTDLLSQLQTFRVYGELKPTATNLKNTLPTFPVIQEEKLAIEFDVVRRTLPHITDYTAYEQEMSRKGRNDIPKT